MSRVGKVAVASLLKGGLAADVTEHPKTLLHAVIEAYDLNRAEMVRVAKALAPGLGIRPISRNTLDRLSSGQHKATEDTIRLIVAVAQHLTGVAWRAGDLFRVDAGGGNAFRAAAAFAAGSNLSVPLFSASDRRSPAWSVSVPEDRGVPPPDVFEALYRDYGVLLRAIAIRRYHIPPDDAEAIVHDCFMSYLERHTYVRSAKGWLSATLANRCVDYCRARRHEAPLGPEYEKSVPDGRSADEIDKFIRDLSWSAVLARIPERCREMLRRRFFAGERQQELAARFSTTRGYVDQLISTCRRMAKEIFLNSRFGSK